MASNLFHTAIIFYIKLIVPYLGMHLGIQNSNVIKYRTPVCNKKWAETTC
jgi:hypothetical protein